MLVSSLSFSVSGALVKALGPSMPLTEIILARSTISLSLAAALSRLQGGGHGMFGQREMVWWLILRGVVGSLS